MAHLSQYLVGVTKPVDGSLGYDLYISPGDGLDPIRKKASKSLRSAISSIKPPNKVCGGMRVRGVSLDSISGARVHFS